jgi:hypothetical protein
MSNRNLNIIGWKRMYSLAQEQIYVPNSQELRNLVLKEIHNASHARHPGYQKEIADVRGQYLWPGMKKYVIDFIARCMEFQKVKAEHRHPLGLLQPLPIPKWK